MDTTTAVLVIIGLFTLIVIVAFFIFRGRASAEIKGPFGTRLTVHGANTSGDRKPGISARRVWSRKGGMKVEDQMGNGIAVERIEVEKDVVLSSSQSPTSYPQQAPSGGLSPGLSAQALTAGGNITLQQFVGSQVTSADQLAYFARQIGVVRPRQDYAQAQFEAYCDAWKSLQALRLLGDDLWEVATSEKLVRFAEQLRRTTTVVREGEIFFEDNDRTQLLDVLEVFARFRVGKGYLIHIRSRGDIGAFSEEDERHAIWMVTEQIKDNRNAKRQYDKLLEDIRDSFRRRLSTQTHN